MMEEGAAAQASAPSTGSPSAQPGPPGVTRPGQPVAPAPADPSARPDVSTFESKRCEPGESVLAWINASQGDSEGIAILTDRRLCFYGRGGKGVRLEAISVQTAQLRYNPDKQPGRLDVRFETEQGEIRFSVVDDLAEAELGNFLGSLKDLRDAQAALRDAGYARKASGEAPSPEYRLMRLKELLSHGLLNEMEYEAQRATLIGEACRES